MLRPVNSSLQYACAVLLIVSSIALAFFQVVTISDVASGVLMYIAQAFLLAGSIFGLDYYVKRLTYHGNQENNQENRETPASGSSQQ